MLNSVALFLNAVFFKGSWRKQFDAAKTLNDTFHSSNGPVQAVYLNDIDHYYLFDSKELNAKILRIPYGQSKFSMFIILPKDDIEDLVKKLSGEAVNREMHYLEKTEVAVKLPKFKFTNSIALKKHLEAVSYL